jgi:hypothetical protein
MNTNHLIEVPIDDICLNPVIWNYPKLDFHEMYIGEILAVLRKTRLTAPA